MARQSTQSSSRRAVKDTARRGGRKKECAFCKGDVVDRVGWVDYKDVSLLRRFVSDRGKIRSRRVSGNCAQHQREVAVAIKTARELALLPYAQRTVAERSGGRRSGPPRGRRDDSLGPLPGADDARSGLDLDVNLDLELDGDIDGIGDADLDNEEES